LKKISSKEEEGSLLSQEEEVSEKYIDKVETPKKKSSDNLPYIMDTNKKTTRKSNKNSNKIKPLVNGETKAVQTGMDLLDFWYAQR
jgi:hypothetical protein